MTPPAPSPPAVTSSWSGTISNSLGCPGPSDPELLYTEEVLRHALPGLRTLLLERRERSQGSDTGEPRIDVVLWAEAPEG